MTRVLILGGTSEANRLADAFAAKGSTRSIPMPGRDADPLGQPLPTRDRRLRRRGRACRLYPAGRAITHVIDATHPFAAADEPQCGRGLCRRRACRCSRWSARPGRCSGDNWIEVPDIDAAVGCPARATRRACSSPSAGSISRRSRPSRSTPIRCGWSMRPRSPAAARCRSDRRRAGRSRSKAIVDLMRSHGIEWLVAKNAGGTGARGQDRRGARTRPAGDHDRTPRPAERPRVGTRGGGAGVASSWRAPRGIDPTADAAGGGIADDDHRAHVGHLGPGLGKRQVSIRSSGVETARAKMIRRSAAAGFAQDIQRAGKPSGRLAERGL